MVRPVPSVDELRMAGQLRAMRERAGLSVAQAAAHVAVAETTVARWEKGESRIKQAHAGSLMSLYGIEPADQERFLSDLQTARQPGWWDQYKDVMAPHDAALLAAMTAANVIRTYEPLTVPWLLQAPDYTWARLRTAGAERPDRTMQAIQECQDRILHAATPPTVWAVTHESALASLALTPALARAQIKHLQDLTDLPHVTVQLIPTAAGLVPGTTLGPLTHLGYGPRGWPDSVFLHGLHTHTRLDLVTDVQRYLAALDALASAVPSGRHTPEHLSQLLAAL